MAADPLSGCGRAVLALLLLKAEPMTKCRFPVFHVGQHNQGVINTTIVHLQVLPVVMQIACIETV